MLDFGDESTNPYDFDQTTTPTPPGGNCECCYIIIIVIPIAAVVVEVGIIIVGVFTSMLSFSASCCCCHSHSRWSRPHCNRRYGHQRKRKGLLSSALATLRHRKLSGHSTPSGHCFTVSLFLVTVTVSLSLNTILVFHRACHCFAKK